MARKKRDAAEGEDVQYKNNEEKKTRRSELGENLLFWANELPSVLLSL